MNCIILEDEPLALNILQSYVEKVPFLKLQASFRDALKALDYLQKNPVDLLFLDINTPDLTGIQLFKSLQNPPMVIFTTAYSQYAIESYDLNAVDYLLKPIEFGRFLKSVNKANERFQSNRYNLKVETTQNLNPDFLFVKSGVKFFKVKIEEILYLEAADNYVVYVTQKKKILSLDRLSKLEETLPKSRFFRVHKSYIIAIPHIEILQKEFITILNQRIPIGRAYRTGFFERIQSV